MTSPAATYTLVGAGAVLGGAALGVYLWNKGRYDDWRATYLELQQQQPRAPDYHDRTVRNNDLADSINHASYLTVGLAVAGGAMLAGGVALWLVNRGTDTRTEEPHRVAPVSGVVGGWGWAWGGAASGGLSWTSAW